MAQQTLELFKLDRAFLKYSFEVEEGDSLGIGGGGIACLLGEGTHIAGVVLEKSAGGGGEEEGKRGSVMCMDLEDVSQEFMSLDWAME